VFAGRRTSDRMDEGASDRPPAAAGPAARLAALRKWSPQVKRASLVARSVGVNAISVAKLTGYRLHVIISV
jgi:hypothetical protein